MWQGKVRTEKVRTEEAARTFGNRRSGFSDHCSLFPTAAVVEEFKEELKSYSISKGTIQFPTDKPLPATLVKRLVKARVAQLQAKKRR